MYFTKKSTKCATSVVEKEHVIEDALRSFKMIK